MAAKEPNPLNDQSAGCCRGGIDATGTVNDAPANGDAVVAVVLAVVVVVLVTAAKLIPIAGAAIDGGAAVGPLKTEPKPTEPWLLQRCCCHFQHAPSRP